MVGLSAILDQFLFVGIPLAVLVAVFVLVVRARSRGGRISVKAKLGVGVLLLLLAVASIRFLRQFREHSLLETLRAEDVTAIDVGDRSFTRQEEIQKIVQAFRQSQWFSSNHGGWAKEVPLTIHFRSNEDRHYRVALYLRVQLCRRCRF